MEKREMIKWDKKYKEPVLPLSNTSGIKGVSFHIGNDKWYAYIEDTRRINLGFYTEKAEAVKARFWAEIEFNTPDRGRSSTALKWLVDHGHINKEMYNF